MTVHRRSGDAVTDRIIAAFDTFEGWRDDSPPEPKFDLWPTDPRFVVGKILPSDVVARPAVTVEASETPGEVPVCPCGARVDDGAHLISEARWRATLAVGEP